MADPNMVDFYDRAMRVERMRRKGYGHEAKGTLGRSHYARDAKPGRGWLMPTLFAVGCAFVLKAGIYTSVGAQSYEDRVALLQSGQGFDPVGGWLMQADPVTVLCLPDKFAG